MSYLVHITRATGLLAVAGLILCMGCASSQDRMLGFGQTSPLAGKWEGLVTAEARWSARGLAPPPEIGQGAGVVIRPDGSFDLNRMTMLGMAGDLSGLRKTGDQTHLQGGTVPKTFRVVWCNYTPTVSQVMIECRLDEATTGEDAEGASASSGSDLLYFSARLNDDGSLSYQKASLSPPAEQSVVMAGVLKWVPPDPSRAELIRQIMRDMPLPDHVIAQRVEHRRLETEAGNEFFLITPKGMPIGLPLVVVLPINYEYIDAEYQAHLWRHQVDNLKIAVAIPIFGDPRLGAFGQNENWALGQELAEKVVDVTPAAEQAVKPTGVFLLAMGEGVLAAHALWQVDNSQFNALVMAEWWWKHNDKRRLPVPEPEAKVDKTRPVYFFWQKPLGSGFRDTPAAANWYVEHGFQNVFTVTTEVSETNKHEKFMAAMLIGRTPDQVTVRHVTEDSPAPIPPRP